MAKNRYFTAYSQVANFLLKEKYATDEVIADTKSDITLFVQPSNMKSSQYAEELVTETLQ